MSHNPRKRHGQLQAVYNDNIMNYGNCFVITLICTIVLVMHLLGTLGVTILNIQCTAVNKYLDYNMKKLFMLHNVSILLCCRVVSIRQSMLWKLLNRYGWYGIVKVIDYVQHVFSYPLGFRNCWPQIQNTCCWSGPQGMCWSKGQLYKQ